MTDDVILAIDNGTQSVRALAFDCHGTLLDKSQVKLTDYTIPQTNWMEHDVDGFWSAVCKACKNLWDQGAVRPDQVRGLVVTTQRATVINLDAAGKPLRPAIIWPDKRQAESTGNLPLKWKLLFRTFGISDTIKTYEQEAESNWIAQNEPAIWEKTHKFLLLSGYLNFRFTGRFVDAVASQVGFIPFDYKKQDWSVHDDWKWPVLNIQFNMLPELAQSGDVIGKVTKAAAADTGIPAETPVIAGASDKACEVLGCGAVTPDTGAISCGTTATINITTPRYVEPLPFIPPYPAAIPGQYNVEVQVTRGFWMVSWFAEEFGLAERQRAETEGGTPETYFDTLIESTAPGADGLMLQPFWNPGISEPGPEARGSVIGFTETHTRAHFYRAIIEGLAYALREGKERIEKRSRSKMNRLCVAGGGSQSDAVMQIIADVLNLPAERPALYEASGLGAAILGSVGLGMHDDIDTAISAMTCKGTTFYPQPENVELYNRLYKDVYLKLYSQMKPIYETLSGFGLAE
jgi:sugar (pentulose or hexulose) kinase